MLGSLGLTNGVAEGKSIILVYNESKGKLNAAGNVKLLCGAGLGVSKSNGSILAICRSHIPVLVVAGLYEYVVISCLKGNGKLAVYELIVADGSIVVSTAVVCTVDVAYKVVVKDLGLVGSVVGIGLAALTLTVYEDVLVIGSLGNVVRIGLAALTLTVYEDVLMIGSGSLNGYGDLTVLEGNGNRAACLYNGEDGIAVGIAAVGIAVRNVPGMILNNLEFIGACRNVLINLNVLACCLVVRKIVVTVIYIPSGTEYGCLVIGVGACNGVSACTAGTHTVRIVGMSGCRNGKLIFLAALRAGVSDLTVLGAGWGSNYSTLARRSVYAAADLDKRPGSAALIPGAFLNCIMVVSAVILKVCGLVPLVSPVVSSSRGVHSAEDDVLNSGRNGALINAVAVCVGHIEPLLAAVPGISREACVISLPIGVGCKVECRGGCRLCRRGNNSHTHQECKHYEKSYKNFACVSHKEFLS